MKCSLCHSDDTFEFLDLGKQPLANKYPKAEDFESEDFFQESVFFCNTCKNVQLGTVIDRDRMFVDYYYLSSVNPGLVRHFEEWAKKLTDAKFVVDIGSNDGILLKPLKELGVKALGVDPSVNVSKIANDQGLRTLPVFFDKESVASILESDGPSDMIIASSVFTHLEDPHTLIDDVKDLMTDDGTFVIEVEYIGNIMKEIQFERFYLDRIYYYSLTSLKHLFELHGMYISDVEDIEPHGGSLRVSAKKIGNTAPPSARVEELLEEEKTTLTKDTMNAFKEEVDANVTKLREMLEQYKKDGVRVAGYGAPARVTTITNYGKIGPEHIEFIIDDSPLKQNKFSPGKHIPIMPKEHLDESRPDLLVVFAYEYFEDIKKKTGGAYRYLLPIPPKEIA